MSTPDPEDKDSYNYDEIMDRLKEVRKAGKRGVKSKKRRKRRSQQPIYVKRRRRLLWAGLLIFLLLPLIIFFGGGFILSYRDYQHEAFRREMSHFVCQEIGAERGGFEKLFEAQQGSFNNSAFQAVGPTGSLLQGLSIGRNIIRVPFQSLFSTHWDVRTVSMHSGRVVLRPRGSVNPADIQKRLPPKASRFGFKGVPETYDLKNFLGRDFEIQFGSNPNALHEIRELDFGGRRVGEEFEVKLDSGIVNFGFWPEMQIVSGSLALSPNGLVTIGPTKMIDQDPSVNASIDLTGTLDFSEGGKGADVIANFYSFNLRDLVPVDWRTRLTGVIPDEDQEPCRFAFKSGFEAGASWLMEGKFVVKDLAIMKIPFLRRLAESTSNAGFEILVFDHFACDLRADKSGLTLRNIKGGMQDSFGIRGHISSSRSGSDSIEGLLAFGVPANVHEKIKPDHISNYVQRGDLNWTLIEVGGTHALPTFQHLAMTEDEELRLDTILKK